MKHTLKILYILGFFIAFCFQLGAQEVTDLFPDFPVEILNEPREADETILPFVFNGYIYTFSLEGESLLWRMFIGGDLTNPFIVEGGTLYLYDVYNRVYSIDMRSGIILWKLELRSVVKGKPCTHHNSLILATQKGIIYVINRRTGRIIYEYKAEGEVNSGPSIYEDLMIVAYKNGRVVAYDTSSKEIQWEFFCNGIINIKPVIKDGYLFIGAWDDTFYVLHADDGTPLWASYVGDNISRDFIVFDEEIVLFFSRGEILCLNGGDGEIKWVKYYQGVEFNYNYYQGRGKFLIFIPDLIALDPEDGTTVFDYRERTFFFYKEMLFENMIEGKVRLNEEERARLLAEKYFTVNSYPLLPPLSIGVDLIYFVADNSYLYIYNLKEDFFLLKYKLS